MLPEPVVVVVAEVYSGVWGNPIPTEVPETVRERPRRLPVSYRITPHAIRSPELPEGWV